MYQPKTGIPCGCRKGQQRDNCPQCEGTGQRIDFAAVRAAVSAPRPPEPTNLETLTFRDAQQAFKEAIAAGRLSDKAEAKNYAGHYMYMGDKLDNHGARVPQFKHIDMREYLPN